MKKFWKINILFAINLCFMTGCIDSDINFANDMIEEGGKIKTFIDTIDIMKSYQCQLDSFPANSTGTGGLGVWHSDSTGTVSASIVTSYVPMGFEEDTFFGYGAEMDSIKLTAAFTNLDGWGDSTVSMRVKVYRLNGIALNKDSVYYSNFPIEKYIDPTPLCSFTTNELSNNSSITLSLPKWYADLHYDNRTDTSNIYVRDDKFINRINGMYFTAEPVNPADRRIIELNLVGSSLRLYYHNDLYTDTTLVQSYIFYNTTLSIYPVDFQIITRDYTTAKPEFGGVDYRVIGDTLESQKRTYVSCPTGLVTRLDFDTIAIQRIREKAKEMGYNNVAILNAELRLKPIYSDYKSMDKMITTLKAYYDVQTPYFLKEYNPVLYSGSSASQYNSIGGNLQRSIGYFSINITGFLQRLFTRANTWNHLDIYPEYTNGLEWGETYLGGTEDPLYKPKLIVTYSFIQQK